MRAEFENIQEEEDVEESSHTQQGSVGSLSKVVPGDLCGPAGHMTIEDSQDARVKESPKKGGPGKRHRRDQADADSVEAP